VQVKPLAAWGSARWPLENIAEAARRPRNLKLRVIYLATLFKIEQISNRV